MISLQPRRTNVFLLAVVVCTVIAAIPAYSVEFSAGGGLSINSVFLFSEFDGTSSNESVTGFGVFGFADATYAELSAGLVLYEDTSYISGSLMLKFPIEISDYTIFPIGGAEYRYNLDYSEASVLSLRGGVGADITLTERLFLRPTLLFGYMFLSDLEEDRIDAYKNFGGASMSKMTIDIRASAGYLF